MAIKGTVITTMARPGRWDAPFDPNMTDEVVAELLRLPEFASVDASAFPRHLPLAAILKNDTRIVQYQTGDLVIRKGDYGNTAFLVLEGMLRVVVSPDLPSDLLGRLTSHKKSWLSAAAQIWTNSEIPELRDTNRYLTSEAKGGMVLSHAPGKSGESKAGTHINLPNVFETLSDYHTLVLEEHAIVGEVAALTRAPRTATVVAQNNPTLLEIRWQALRDISMYAANWRAVIDRLYRDHVPKTLLQASPIFSTLDKNTLDAIADAVLFETFGTFDWYASNKLQETEEEEEAIIAAQGDYADGLLLIGSGFARVSVNLGHGRRTLTCLKAGDTYGLDELYEGWKSKKPVALETSLSALGYVDAIRVPTHVLEKYVFPNMTLPQHRLSDASQKPLADDPLLEFSVAERFINGTQAMLIDLDRCVRCDDCVTACASTHGGNPRFVRHGKTFDHWMVANACMHCVDAVCLSGCPTGAIHRTVEGGKVVINDNTCIGCGVCADACPYENIRLVEIRDLAGNPVLDPEHHTPIIKATKCDLCADQLGGPACVRACPHDALRRVDFNEGRR